MSTKNGLVIVDDNDANVNFIRIDMTYQVVAELVKQKNYQDIINKRYGKKQIDGVVYCSGGYIGAKGTVVVDDVHGIQYKYGIANGDGSIDYFENKK